MMSTEIAGQEYIEELCILVGIAVLLLLTKLYACCVVSGAYNQARVISYHTDPLSRVRSIPQSQSSRFQVAQTHMLEMSGLPN